MNFLCFLKLARMESRQPDINISSNMTLFASTIALIMRLIARRTKKFNMWWDDYFAIAAWVSADAFFNVEHRAETCLQAFAAGATIFGTIL